MIHEKKWEQTRENIQWKIKQEGWVVNKERRLRPLPGTDPADVDVDEVGFGVISDPPLFHRHRDLAQIGEIPAREVDVDRLPLHVEAFFGYSRRMAGKFGVRLGGTVARNDVKRFVAPHP